MTILDDIKKYKLEEIAARIKARPIAELETAVRHAGRTRGFYEALKKRSVERRYGLIAEIKKASPSKGLIREDFDPPALAAAYEAGGATCLSVLTDTPSFQGADEYLTTSRNATSLPVIRKDFLYDPYQVFESRVLGADCILIIMATVSDLQARELEDAAKSLNMDAIIEVHDQAELERALELKSRLIGINNRDLRTFETRLEVTENLAPQIPNDRLVVGESGLRNPADLARMKRAGVTTFLIGESLMRQPDVTAATRALLAEN